jgi:hypothetical protein
MLAVLAGEFGRVCYIHEHSELISVFEPRWRYQGLYVCLHISVSLVALERYSALRVDLGRSRAW